MDTVETDALPTRGGGVKVTRPSSNLSTDLSAGLLVAFLSASFSMSYAALLFAGTAPAIQAQGLVMLLVGSAVAAVVGVRLSSLPFSVLVADGSLVALLATATASAVSDMAGASDAVVAATLVTMLMLATLLTGASLWLIGALGVGGIARFVPFQVMAGVLAASGWALASGGIAVAAGHPAGFAMLADPHSLHKLALALLLAVAMLASARVGHPAAMPAVIAAAILLYHGVALWAGWPATQQRDAGWLLALPPRLTLPVPWSPATLAAVDWPVLAAHATSLLALIPMTAIVLLLGLSGLEAASRADIAADRDLKANGLAAIASGALGGMLGITSVNRSLLMFGMGVQGSRASVFAGVASGLVPLLWPGLLGAVPRFVLGGLLLFAGFGMLRQWVLRSRRRLTLSEWLTVLAVLAVSARFGLIVGVSTGLLLGCITFAVIYSRGSPIRALYRGEAARSRVDRSDHAQGWLARHAETVLVLHLQGFVFFGTASRLIDVVRREIAAKPGKLRHLLLEFSTVQGIDGSALASFERLLRLVASERISLAFAAMPASVAVRLAGLDAGIHITDTLDAALEWWEEAVLASLPTAQTPSLAALLTVEFDAPEQAAAFLSLLERAEFGPGEVLMHQGELSDDLLFIERGQASVTVQFSPGEGAMRVRTFGVGTMVGEIGFCLGLPRTATVTADGMCSVLRLTRLAMQRLEAEHPAAALAFQRAVLRRISERLLTKDELISALRLDRAR